MKIFSFLKLIMLSVAFLFTFSNLKARFYSNKVGCKLGYSSRLSRHPNNHPNNCNKFNLFQTTVTSGSVKVRDIGIPMYLTINLLEGFDVERLDLHGYHSLYHFFMGFVGDPISYKNGCDWTGSKNSTINGMFLELPFYKLTGTDI